MPSYACFDGCGLWANCKNRGQRTRLQWRLGRLSERVFSRGRRPDTNQRIRIRVLKDVACGPIVKTGAGLPGDRGGLQNPVR
jgi:hypothetical protein